MSTEEFDINSLLTVEMQQRIACARQARALLEKRGRGAGPFAAQPTEYGDTLDIVNLASWLLTGEDPWADSGPLVRGITFEGCTISGSTVRPTDPDDERRRAERVAADLARADEEDTLAEMKLVSEGHDHGAYPPADVAGVPWEDEVKGTIYQERHGEEPR